MNVPELTTLLMSDYLDDEDIISLRATCYDIKNAVDNCTQFWKRKMDRDMCFMKHFGGHVNPCTKGNKCRKYEHYYDVSSGIRISESPKYSHTFKGYMLRKMDCNWKTMYWDRPTMELYYFVIDCLRREISYIEDDTEIQRVIVTLLRKKIHYANSKRKVDWVDYDRIRPDTWTDPQNKRLRF